MTIRSGVLAGLLVSLVGLPPMSARATAGPANDNFADAVEVSGLPFTHTLTNAGATIEPGEPHPCGDNGGTVWYRFVPDRDALIGVGAGEFPTVVGAYSGSTFEDLVHLGCGMSEAYTVLTGFAVSAGSVYYLQAAGLAGSEGTLQIRLFEGGAISGTVTDESGAPLERICVAAEDPDTNWRASGRWTDSSGAYRIVGIPSGDYFVGFRDCNDPARYVIESYPDRVPIGTGREMTGIDAALAFGGSISGRVTDEASQSLEGICIEAFGANWGFARSDSAGHYWIGALPSGDYTINFYDCNEPARYLSETYNDKRDGEPPDSVPVVQGSETGGIDAALTLGGAISGRVTNTAGEALEGICVEASSDSGSEWALADASGLYVAGRLVAGAYKVRFTDCNYPPRYADEYYNDKLDWSTADPIAVVSGMEVRNIDASLAALPVSAGVRITESDGSTQVVEGGALDTYQVVLASGPTADVRVRTNPGPQLSASPATLVFGPSNWNIPQTVTVSAVDDHRAQGARAVNIGHESQSADPAYDGIAVAGVEVAIADDDAAGIAVTESDDSTQVVEGGAPDTYQVSLTSEPTNPVTITMDSDPQLQMDPTAVVFDASNWSILRTVSVSAVDDHRAQGPRTASINHSAASGDPGYDGIPVRGIVAAIADDDHTGVQIVESDGTTEVTEGGTPDTYQISLTSEPTNPVTITLDSDAQLSASPTTLVFDASNWSIPQTVSVSAVDDCRMQGDRTVVVSQAVSSADPQYEGLPARTVLAKILDDDAPRGRFLKRWLCRLGGPLPSSTG